MAGIIRAGYQVFAISPRNSAPAVAHLLGRTRCQHLFVSTDAATTQLAQSALERLALDEPEHKVHKFKAPIFETLFHNNENTPLLPPFEESNMDAPALI